MTTLALARTVPPGPSGTLVLGSLRDLSHDPLDLFLRAATEHGGLVRFRFAHLHAYLVSEPAYIKHILADNMANYKKGVSYASLRYVMGDGLLVAEGDLWRRQRRLMQPAFARQSLASKAPAILECVESAQSRWTALAHFDLLTEMMRLAFDVVGRVLMGSDIGAEIAEVESVLPEVSRWVYKHVRAPIKLSPKIPTPGNLRYRRALAVLHRVVDRVIAKRRAREGDNDLLSLLMAARDDDTGKGMSDRQLRDEVLTFLLAGHETTGSALSWVFALLAEHPDCEARLHAELDAVLGGRPPTADDLPRLPYAGQVIDEAMRLYPPAWSFTRTAVDHDQLGPFAIPRGAMIVISPWVNHRLPRFWSAPDAFDPSRFAAAAASAHDPYQYFPFGGGPHLCIGKYLTLFEVKLAVAAIAQRHRIRRQDAAPIPLAPEITLRPGAPIRVRLERRA